MVPYGVKNIATKFNRLSRGHERHRRYRRQADRLTVRRQTTDGRAIALYSVRKREFTLAKNEGNAPDLYAIQQLCFCFLCRYYRLSMPAGLSQFLSFGEFEH